MLPLIGVIRPGVIGALAFASMAACAHAGAVYPDDLSTDQSAQLGQICTTVIRVERGEAQYDACVSSLADSLQSVGHDRAMQRKLALGTPGQMDEPGTSRSYFQASHDEVFRRARLSCTRLGFDPASGAFASCVASLAGALDSTDRPVN